MPEVAASTGVARFFVLACGLSWFVWSPLVAAGLGGSDARPTPYLHLLGGFGPACAAFALGGGRRGFQADRRALAWIAGSALAPVVIFGAGILLFAATGQWSLFRASGPNPEYPQLSVGAYVLASLVCYGFGEEIGWRGFALPRLQARHSALTASLIVAAGWAVWHLPLFAFAPGMKALGVGGALGWLASIVAGSLLMTFVFNGSGGSVIATAVFHTVLDLLMLGPAPGPLVIAMGAIVTVVGIALPLAFGPARLAPHPRITQEDS